MDVSALTRQLSRAVVATAVAETTPAAQGEAAGPGARDTSTASSSSFSSPSEHNHQVDVSRAVAERLVANIDNPTPAEAAPAPAVSSELWIPTWVRAAYHARARHGWYLPPPAALAGYTDDTADEVQAQAHAE